MESAGPRHVSKYLPLADRFVRVRRCGPREAGLHAGEELNRDAYRRRIVEACLPELLPQGLDEELERLAPGQPAEALEVLYQVCVDVNPKLEIHTVQLPPLDPETSERERAGAPSGTVLHATGPSPRRARELEKRLSRRVIGQPEAVARVAAAVRRNAAGLALPDRPRASFLFAGPTGTGKTELAKALQAELAGADARPITIDGSELSQPHEIARLLGAPPGYVGFEEGGQLAREVTRRPDAVILFDEVEKAHPNLHRLLLQVLDEGRLTDGRGDTVDFTHSVIVLTTNAGALERRDARRAAGFRSGPHHASGLGEVFERALADRFAPELLGRLDELVAFRDLDRSDALTIARNALRDLAVRVRRNHRRVRFTPAVARWVVEHSFGAEAGAREVLHLIRRRIEAPLADALLGSQNDWLAVSIRAGEPHVAPAD